MGTLGEEVVGGLAAVVDGFGCGVGVVATVGTTAAVLGGGALVVGGSLVLVGVLPAE